MSVDYIITVTEADFEYEVLAYSQNVPVIMDFWAEWCKPCKTLTPILEKMAHEAEGDFRLAKVNVDDSPNLALRFGIHSIPTVIAISQGRKVSDFSGAIPEARVREFIGKLMPPSPSSLLAQKGFSLLSLGQVEEARKAFLEALDIDAHHPASLLGMMKVYLLTEQSPLAREIYERFPASPEFNEVERLLPFLKATDDLQRGRLPNETDLDAAFVNSIRLANRGNVLAGIDGLLEILRQDKRFRKEKAHQVVLALLELLDPENDQTRDYRSELASILFK
jgi:putative thioredoxin